MLPSQPQQLPGPLHPAARTAFSTAHGARLTSLICDHAAEMIWHRT